MARATQPSDAEYARELVTLLEREPLAKTYVERAKMALERERRLKDLGDLPRATLAGIVARSWAEFGREVVGMARKEKEARSLEEKVVTAEQATVKYRAEYEQATASVLRLKAEVQRVEAEPVPIEEVQKKKRARKGRGH